MGRKKKYHDNDDYESRLWDKLMNNPYDYEDDDEDDDDDDWPPYGCLACGNPAYPKCTTSCKMFDD